MKNNHRFLSFIASMPVHWGEPRQASVQTSTHISDLNSLKLATKCSAMTMHRLRPMEVIVNHPTTAHYNDEAVVTKTTTVGSILNKKNLALSWNFYQEIFSAEIIVIQ